MAQYFFNEPRFAIQWPDLDDTVRFVIFIGTSFVITRITRSLENARVRSAQALFDLQEEKRVREFFVTALTHDLRSPLTSAAASAQLLCRGDPRIDEDKMKKRVLAEIRRADRLIQNLLDVSRLNAGQTLGYQVESIDLSVWLQEVAEEICGMRTDCAICVDVPSGLTGSWSVDSLRRVIENLVGNAIKYGETGREITLTAEDRGEWVLISIHNWGRAISEDDLPRLFTPFRRTSQAVESGKKGWGVGLSLVKGLVEAQGGNVGARSDAEAGTTFWVLLPKDARKSEERESA